MRLCVIGDSPDVRHCAVALVEQGHQVYWLASTEALRTLHNGAAQLTVATDILPSTCQYVVPVQAYHYEGIRLVCVNQEFWQHPDLHTRLFTYLCLLQRALPCSLSYLGSLAHRLRDYLYRALSWLSRQCYRIARGSCLPSWSSPFSGAGWHGRLLRLLCRVRRNRSVC